MRTEPPSPRQPVLAGSASRHVITTWDLLAGENERVTSAVRDLTGHAPRSVEAFRHENRELFR